MPKVTGLGHVGLYIKDPAVMVDFYEGFLGLTVTDRGPDDRIVFMSARPDAEHHELALVRDESRHTDVQQLSFTVGSLDDLRTFYDQITERGYPVDRTISHGNAFGCYFRDPENNQVEVYWHTGRDCPQPHGDPIDLTASEEELMAAVQGMPLAAHS
ncbi:MAG: VOC family protein [Acidimicrobiaceae bacterium]|nr:VOC family protein [Acidimicrobiaceae bacterium]